MSVKVFISSNQAEFQEEIEFINNKINDDAYLYEYIDLFMFEIDSAKPEPSNEVFINKINESDVYIGLIGENYGNIYVDDISATEFEYNTFISRKHDAYFFVKNTNKRDEGSKKFFNRIRGDVKYKKFNNKEELLIHIKSALKETLDRRFESKEFDCEIIHESSLDDVDGEAIELFKQVLENDAIYNLFDVRSVDKILEYLNAGVIDENNNFKLTNTGALFFAKDVSKFNIDHEIKMVKFDGTDGIDIIDKKFTKSSFFKVINEFENFFRNNIKKGLVVNGMKSTPIPEYPINAVREAFINALAHRDYTIKGDCITFYIYDDRIEIINPGRLLYPLTIETLGITQNPKHRNENICNIFEKTKYMEHVGTGIKRMRREMDKANLPEPEFYENGYFKVILYGPNGKLILPKKETFESLKLGQYDLNSHQIDALLTMINDNEEFTCNTYSIIYDVSIEVSKRDLKDLYEKNLIKKQIKGKTCYYSYLDDYH